MDSESQGQTTAQHGAKKASLQESSKLELIRYVSGEFAKAAKSLPAGKEGFLLYVEKPLNQELLPKGGSERTVQRSTQGNRCRSRSWNFATTRLLWM